MVPTKWHVQLSSIPAISYPFRGSVSPIFIEGLSVAGGKRNLYTCITGDKRWKQSHILQALRCHPTFTFSEQVFLHPRCTMHTRYTLGSLLATELTHRGRPKTHLINSSLRVKRQLFRVGLDKKTTATVGWRRQTNPLF